MMGPGVCLVGCGQIARTHARNLRGKAGLYFHSRTQESAARLATEFAGEVISGWGETLRRPEIQALVICTPPELHCEQAVAALQAGKSVLVEKPLCVTREEIAQLEAVAESATGVLMVAENYYYKPSVALLRRLVERGDLGSLQQLRVRKLFSQSSSGWKRGYGALLEGGIHFVALISAVAESVAEDIPGRVTCTLPERAPGEPERCSTIRLEYAGGLTAELAYAWNRPAVLRGLLQHSHLQGERGRVIFESNGLYTLLVGEHRRRLYWPDLRDLMGYGTMMKDFLVCLQQPGHRPYSNLARARRDLEIVFSAYAAAE